MITVKLMFRSKKTTAEVLEFITTAMAGRQQQKQEGKEGRDERNAALRLEGGQIDVDDEKYRKEARASDRSGEMETEEKWGQGVNVYIAEEITSEDELSTGRL